MSMISRLTALFAVAALSACASTSPVVPVGNGVYEITGSSATALSSGSAQKVRLIQAANDYCAKQGKAVTVVNAGGTDGHVGSYASANGSAYGPNSGANFNAAAVTPGQRASADVMFRCG